MGLGFNDKNKTVEKILLLHQVAIDQDPIFQDEEKMCSIEFFLQFADTTIYFHFPKATTFNRVL